MNDLLQVFLPHLFPQLSVPILIFECVWIKPVQNACPLCDIMATPLLIPSLSPEVYVIRSVHELSKPLMRLLELFHIGPLDCLQVSLERREVWVYYQTC